jgi:ATP-dependent RNA circularization protein (DNA/RNA ligase family)
MNTFFRFPHTPHLVWLGKEEPRDDKVLSTSEAKTLLAGEVVVEEKVDGANLGISLDENGQLQVQNRGQYLLQPFYGQFSRLNVWLGQHQQVLLEVLDNSIILFGEWCAARHSLDYDALPDWFLLFDVYDRQQDRFWSTTRRNTLASITGISVVSEVRRTHLDMASIRQLVMQAQSSYRQGQMEGVVIRRETTDWTEQRAKLVHPDFTQTIDEHWRSRTIKWNQCLAC